MPWFAWCDGVSALYHLPLAFRHLCLALVFWPFSIVFRRYFILNSVSLDSSNFSLSITRFLTLIRPPYRLVIGVFLRKWQVYSLSALFLPLSYLATLGARSPLSSPLSFDVLTLTHLVALLFCSVILGIHSALAGSDSEPREQLRDRDAAKRGPGLRKYIFNAQSQKTII